MNRPSEASEIKSSVAIENGFQTHNGHQATIKDQQGPSAPLKVGANGSVPFGTTAAAAAPQPPKLTEILSPANVAPPPPETIKENPIEEAVYTFDQLVQQEVEEEEAVQRQTSCLPNGTTAAASHRQPRKSFIEFDDDDEVDSASQARASSRSGRPTSERLRRLRRGSSTTSGSTSTDQTFYRNDEELKNVFSAGLAADQSKTRQCSTGESSEEWNDFQGSTVVVEETKPKLVESNEHLKGQKSTTSEIIEEIKSEADRLQVNIPTTKELPERSLDGDSEEEDEEEDVITEDLTIDEEDEDGASSSLLFGRVQQMEAEQELLNNSLLALTSHFAQVQLRLRQIVEAKDVPVEKRETLLQELESFANRGIPELMMTMAPASRGAGSGLERTVSMATSLMVDDVFEEEEDEEVPLEQEEESISVSVVNGEVDENGRKESNGRSGRKTTADSASSYNEEQTGRSRVESCSTTTAWITEEKLERQRHRQKELIGQLKEQLEDLERYAYETGELNGLPSSMLLERQNAIIEQLKAKLPVLSIGQIDKLSPEELRKKVDSAVRELVNPVLMKEQLVDQLRTQVTDLERFIDFLQKGGKNKEKHKHLIAAAAAASAASTPNSKFAQMSKFLKLRSRKQATKSELSTTKAAAKTTSKAANAPIEQPDSTTTPTSCDSRTSVSNTSESTKLQQQQANGTRANKRPGDKATPSTESPEAAAATSLMHRMLSLLHMFALTQLGGCASFASSRQPNTTNRHQRPTTSGVPFERNALKSATRHWGDLRAHLELSIAAIIELYREKQMNAPPEAACSADAGAEQHQQDFISLGGTAFVINNYFAYEQMTLLVRKDLAVALRNLMQHGLIGAGEAGYGPMEVVKNGFGVQAPKLRASMSRSKTIAGLSSSGAVAGSSTASGLLSFGLGCFGVSGGGIPSLTHAPITRPMHAWEVILYFYDLKNGSKFRATPSRRLSQSFGLSVVTGSSINPKHSLLAAIDDIIDTHTRHKRSLDSHFKAFISMGLNQQMLSQWLRLIVRNATLVADCYEKWSYTASTGFEDALRQLDKLASLRFCLPTDLALRQLQSIHDAF